ncbi:hypothetical protein [Candidatus Poriferisodalis sp.]|uniref:hypothetical protein n=1 Tax=Candidatus Poriferisodalis sp. TaxID=3101277 RepID=UPI003B025ABB
MSAEATGDAGGINDTADVNGAGRTVHLGGMNGTDEAYSRRLTAVVAGHRGDARLAESLLDDVDAGVRGAALGALARCGTLGVEQVRRALDDESAAVRRRAAEVAPPGVALVQLLSDTDSSVVEAAAAALGERSWDFGAVAALCRVAADHSEPLCRESAIAALGALAAGLDAGFRTGDAANGLAGVVAQRRIGASTRCAERVGGDEAGGHHLEAEPVASAHDPDSAACAEAGGTAVASAAVGAWPDARHDAAPTATDRRDTALTMMLQTLLHAMSDRPQIRRRALLGLHQFEDHRAVGAVQAALEDRDSQVRAVAGELLGVPVR